jgi:uncharacterized protein YydD (DUF2326 family)
LNQTNNGLEVDIRFDIEDVQRVFKEAEITFPEQLVRDYSELVTFNKKILTERRSALREKAKNIDNLIRSLEKEAEKLSKKRQEILKILGDSNSLQKYKNLQKELDGDRASLAFLEEKVERLEAISVLDDELREIKEKCNKLTVLIKELLKKKSDSHEAIKKNFNKIVSAVLHRNAILYAKQNDIGNLDFHAEYLDSSSESETQERQGTSFRKILCMAFDLAVLVNYSQKPFFHFVYHDGALEQLESKRKLALLSVIRKVCSNHGLQYIFSVLEEELPLSEDIEKLCPKPDEVVLSLHDGGIEGRLFKLERF